jgi:hypothetical protein
MDQLAQIGCTKSSGSAVEAHQTDAAGPRDGLRNSRARSSLHCAGAEKPSLVGNRSCNKRHHSLGERQVRSGSLDPNYRFLPDAKLPPCIRRGKTRTLGGTK